jgi:hypothetical protein
MPTILPVSLTSSLQALYSADILYILSVCFTKLSLLIFIRQLTIDDAQRRGILIFVLFTILSTFAAIFASAFQCHAPQAWQVLSLKCFNQV